MEPFGSASPAVADVSLLRGEGRVIISSADVYIKSACVIWIDFGLSGDAIMASSYSRRQEAGPVVRRGSADWREAADPDLLLRRDVVSVLLPTLPGTHR